jgi:hypothetical protein
MLLNIEPSFRLSGMEMVDMSIIRFWIYGRKSRSVNNSSQRSDFGTYLGLLRQSRLAHLAQSPTGGNFAARRPARCQLISASGHLEMAGAHLARSTGRPGVKLTCWSFH